MEASMATITSDFHSLVYKFSEMLDVMMSTGGYGPNFQSVNNYFKAFTIIFENQSTGHIVESIVGLMSDTSILDRIGLFGTSHFLDPLFSVQLKFLHVFIDNPTIRKCLKDFCKLSKSVSMCFGLMLIHLGNNLLMNRLPVIDTMVLKILDYFNDFPVLIDEWIDQLKNPVATWKLKQTIQHNDISLTGHIPLDEFRASWKVIPFLSISAQQITMFQSYTFFSKFLLLLQKSPSLSAWVYSKYDVGKFLALTLNHVDGNNQSWSSKLRELFTLMSSQASTELRPKLFKELTSVVYTPVQTKIILRHSIKILVEMNNDYVAESVAELMNKQSPSLNDFLQLISKGNALKTLFGLTENKIRAYFYRIGTIEEKRHSKFQISKFPTWDIDIKSSGSRYMTSNFENFSGNQPNFNSKLISSYKRLLECDVNILTAPLISTNNTLTQEMKSSDNADPIQRRNKRLLIEFQDLICRRYS